MMLPEKLKILIADDHPIFLKGLQEVIEDEARLQVVFKASNGTDAIQGALNRDLDIAILDIDSHIIPKTVIKEVKWPTRRAALC
ncbi:response regulator transcription factor [Paraflavitalea pollutisoli]|uniref:response regulator transcription factor n=1 Tax=Paraflavitalea pollutisoli TaxID=3034143 RepID=UPI0023EAD277|nr:response regulator [Paraflavitalea sp. H1-2-19X]